MKNMDSVVSPRYKKILKWIGAISAVLFSGIATKYLPDELPKYNNELKNSQDQKKQSLTKTRNERVVLPDLRSPILDGNIYIEKEFNHLILGGANFKYIRYSARKENGDVAKILEKGENFISFQVYDMPYIELEYKDKFYALKIIPEYPAGDMMAMDYSIMLFYSITEIKEPSMYLENTKII